MSGLNLEYTRWYSIKLSFKIYIDTKIIWLNINLKLVI